jgi:hypothetical protein
VLPWQPEVSLVLLNGFTMLFAGSITGAVFCRW